MKIMTLPLIEHHKYYKKEVDHFTFLKKYFPADFFDTHIEEHVPLFFKNNKLQPCLKINFFEEQATIENSYYIGLAWLRPWNKAVHISPKLNTDESRLNHIRMLTEALQEPENLNHLDDLMDIRFDEEWIEVDGSYELELTPFLMAQFLMCVRSIVRKSLKKEYYRVTENLQSRIKGKVLVTQQIRQNVVKHRLTNTVCSYQEYGIDTASNRFLKYVLHFVASQVHYFQDEDLKKTLLEPLVYNLGAFQRVSEKKFYTFKDQENNPMYREYDMAIKLGNQILKLMDHNLSKTTETLSKYPPHWIDMSKLFELYVFKKLREKFTGSNEVKYHPKANRQELDFIIRSGDFKAVVDAKYKPRYKNGNPSMEDARQLSGYARLNKIYSELEIDDNELIPVYVVYPQELRIKDELEWIDHEEDQLPDPFDGRIKENRPGQSLFKETEKVRQSTSYREFYMQEIEMSTASIDK